MTKVPANVKNLTWFTESDSTADRRSLAGIIIILTFQKEERLPQQTILLAPEPTTKQGFELVYWLVGWQPQLVQFLLIFFEKKNRILVYISLLYHPIFLSKIGLKM